MRRPYGRRSEETTSVGDMRPNLTAAWAAAGRTKTFHLSGLHARAHHGFMLTSKDVTRQNFTPATIRRGYDEREVDDFLDEVIETLRYYEQGGRPVAQAPDSPASTNSAGLAQRAPRRQHGDHER